jgi:hypothetical protein
MASKIFDPGLEGILDETIKLNSNDIRAMLVKSTYTFDATDKFLADLGAVDNGRSVALGSKTFTNGVFDAADSSLAALAAAASNALVIFQHTGSDATARVIAYIDAATGLPMTPAVGQTVNLTWDNGANKIFKIVNP